VEHNIFVARTSSALGKILVFCALVVLGICSKPAVAQTFNLYEGLGVLENGWTDESTCTRNFKNTNYVYEGTYSTEVNYTAGGQEFLLNFAPGFTAGYFSGLSFYVNGGANGGRTVNISLMVNGSLTNTVSLNSYISGGSVAAHTWSQVVVPFSAFGITATGSISQVLLQEATGGPQPPFYVGEMGFVPNVPSAVSIALSAVAKGRTVDQKMFAVNTAAWDNGLTSSTSKTLIANAGFQAFRFPGGPTADSYNWQTNTSGSTTFAVNFDQFATVALTASKGQCFITANYGSGSPAQAAQWVTYSNVTKKYGMKYWEIGNDVYESSENDAHTKPHDPVTYAQQFAQYYSQMKAVDSTISIGAVAAAGEDSYANYASESVVNPRTGVRHSGWTPVMLATLKQLGVTPDFIIYHRFQQGGVDCDLYLLTSIGGWATDITNLRQQLTDYLGTNGAKSQIMCTETNSDGTSPGKQMCSLVNALYMADSFGALLQTECKGFAWWDLLNGQVTNSNDGTWLYGWRTYGDYGMISPDFTETYPVYYAEQLLNLFAKPGDTILPTTYSYGLLTAYAVKGAQGTIRLLVINKNTTATLTANIAISGFVAGKTATVHFYGIPQDTAASQGLSQAISTTLLRNASSKMTLDFAPYSITVIEIPRQLAVSTTPRS
jgi:hypothetical protein